MKEISDMYLAATLMAYGAELENIDRSNSRRLKFTFSGPIEQIFVDAGNSLLRIENPEFDVLENHFIGTTLWYPPNFTDCLKKIKSAIHGV